MKPMLCTVTMTLKVVTLELTDQLSGRKYGTNMGRVPTERNGREWL